eukprot:7453110-Pyramimonas_sp.AAC.1
MANQRSTTSRSPSPSRITARRGGSRTRATRASSRDSRDEVLAAPRSAPLAMPTSASPQPPRAARSHRGPRQSQR